MLAVGSCIDYLRIASHHTHMKIAFKLGNTTLDKAEANALMSTTGKEPTFEIDIAKHIDPSLIDAKKLFNLSVEKQLPKLATLAARFAIEGVKPTKAKRAVTNRIVDIVPNAVTDKPDEVIADLNQMTSLRSLGAAMILYNLRTRSMRTLRQIAVDTVNEIAFKGEVSADSACFRGFLRDSEGGFKPLIQDGTIVRSECYHASPMYTMLRDGLTYLTQIGLVKTLKTIEYGSTEKRLNANSTQLRRAVYRVDLTDVGRETAEMWYDLSDYITTRWSQRIRSRDSYASV